MLNTLRTLWFLLKIRMTTRGWFLTHNLVYWDGVPVPNKIIRYYDDTHSLICPIQAIGVNISTREAILEYNDIIYAADNPYAPWRKALLWATRLKEADAS